MNETSSSCAPVSGQRPFQEVITDPTADSQLFARAHEDAGRPAISVGVRAIELQSPLMWRWISYRSGLLFQPLFAGSLSVAS